MPRSGSISTFECCRGDTEIWGGGPICRSRRATQKTRPDRRAFEKIGGCAMSLKTRSHSGVQTIGHAALRDEGLLSGSPRTRPIMRHRQGARAENRLTDTDNRRTLFDRPSGACFCISLPDPAGAAWGRVRSSAGRCGIRAIRWRCCVTGFSCRCRETRLDSRAVSCRADAGSGD